MRKTTASALILVFSLIAPAYAQTADNTINDDIAKLQQDSDTIHMDQQELVLAKTNTERTPITTKLEEDQKTLAADKDKFKYDRKHQQKIVPTTPAIQ